jgi:hypothetical protein
MSDAAMLTLAYDTIDYAPDRRRVRAQPNGGAPGGAWLLRLCLLVPERLGFERTAALVDAGRPFVYPIELATDSRAGAPAPPHSVALALPEAVCAAARRGRAGILVWLGDRATPLELDAAGQAWLFDVVELLILKNALPPDAVWFATGTVSALEDFGEWQRLRGFCLPELFHLRALTVFPGLARATFRANAEGRAVTLTPASDGAAALETVALSAEAFRARYVAPDEIDAERRAGRLREHPLVYVSDGAALHQRLVLAVLHDAGRLETTLTGFPAPPTDAAEAADFAAALPGAPVLAAQLVAAWRALAPRLPLVADDAPHRRGYVAIASEPTVDGYPLATGGALAPLLNLQPFVWVGAADTMRYLRALGFRTFGRVLDERYDAPDGIGARLLRVLGQIEVLGARDGAALRDLYVACLPELLHNRAHVIEGRHQLDRLLEELESAYGG